MDKPECPEGWGVREHPHGCEYVSPTGGWVFWTAPHRSSPAGLAASPHEDVGSRPAASMEEAIAIATAPRDTRVRLRPLEIDRGARDDPWHD